MPTLTTNASDDFDDEAATRQYRTRYRTALAATPAAATAVLTRASNAFRGALSRREH